MHLSISLSRTISTSEMATILANAHELKQVLDQRLTLHAALFTLRAYTLIKHSCERADLKLQEQRR